MATLSTDVLVIGGGATGTGITWDASLRGLDVVLIDRQDLAEGTSGRFHGLLHSGGRYAVKDPRAAVECIGENRILRRVASDCIEDTGGFFVTTPWDDPAYADRLAQGCAETGVDCEEISVAQALREEPRLNPQVSRVFRVPDANIDVWKTVWAMAHGAQQRGARILPYHAAIAIHREGDAITGARVRDARTGEESEIQARVTVNAGGAWAGQIADLAGIEGVRVLPGRGIMVAMNHRLVNTVVNRCQMPTDGDIIVPIRTVSVVGTTDVNTDDPDDHTVNQNEVDLLLDEGEKLVPGFRQARALRVWTGVRPLFEDDKPTGTDSRDVTRAHALLDHEQRDGIRGFVTITGGKLTTFRLMAEETVDAVCRHLGETRPCRTATESLPGSESGETYRLGERLARKEAKLIDEQIICECELVPRSKLEEAISRTGSTNLDDIRRQLRLGMGPCQGGFCIYRAAGIMQERDRLSAKQADTSLLDFLQERWKGEWPVLYGDQLRQARLDDWIFQGVLDVAHLPR
ncbi:MAG TPA: anaerobic glycerol-3-phosphate dehydrogenase subunit GlpA [Solirubrobacteraceae bacterium]|jgi:glycerol-3-phosphate dehydrogenase|nr:anaerobic glycerol-3-phosphate dehydrogenase subunit GlpA [Solirubrobacteraceae bacterium]